MAGSIRKLLKSKKTGSENAPQEEQPGENAAPAEAPSPAEVPTTPLPREAFAPAEMPEAAPHEPAPPEIGFYQSVGRQRDHNEDSLLVISASLATDNEFVPFGLYIIADGMGGHSQGEVASGLAARIVAAEISRKIMPALFSPAPAAPQESILEIMEAGVQKAHQAILQEAPGSGTTLTALLHLKDRLTIAHVGDSRAYLVQPDGAFQPLTRDHSLVMRMIEMGRITEAEAATHPQRNVLYRAVGQGEALTADITAASPPDAGWLMLCSDGLWGVVPAAELGRIITSALTPQAACREMVEAANAAGGPDNISVILVRLA